ncbi:MAG TPA: bifunctional precorrin-2 dehydrogenase/sirohydrochlorin ferrochelatase [Syntrophaceticus sp.]|nr:bifunctional precorrin-2 dehydrogenase/sirohydrochlorin ferrochelatase [Syntrophaceticus sp.]
MELYPVFLNLENKKCLVVGGGSVAERKISALLQCGCEITVVSPSLTPALQKMVEHGDISYRKGVYQEKDLDGVYLVISATDDAQLNSLVAGDCNRRNIMVNVVDDPDHCSFFVPSVVQRGALKIAISTGGKSPKLAKIIREELEKEFGLQFEEFVEFIGKMRERIIAEVDDPQLRNQILKGLVDHHTLDLIKQGDLQQAKERVKYAYHRSRG